ncbi:hypothetical protein NOCA2790008 [metagenome]|uniref:Uncharacterized protein n=1 Tax=metagenome TaxID=256318 RepID=A0A2P2CER0_9ZZZZ
MLHLRHQDAPSRIVLRLRRLREHQRLQLTPARSGAPESTRALALLCVSDLEGLGTQPVAEHGDDLADPGSRGFPAGRVPRTPGATLGFLVMRRVVVTERNCSTGSFWVKVHRRSQVSLYLPSSPNAGSPPEGVPLEHSGDR